MNQFKADFDGIMPDAGPWYSNHESVEKRPTGQLVRHFTIHFPEADVAYRVALVNGRLSYVFPLGNWLERRGRQNIVTRQSVSRLSAILVTKLENAALSRLASELGDHVSLENSAAQIHRIIWTVDGVLPKLAQLRVEAESRRFQGLRIARTYWVQLNHQGDVTDLWTNFPDPLEGYSLDQIQSMLSSVGSTQHAGLESAAALAFAQEMAADPDIHFFPESIQKPVVTEIRQDANDGPIYRVVLTGQALGRLGYRETRTRAYHFKPNATRAASLVSNVRPGLIDRKCRETSFMLSDR
jgi:hypothetical protein